MNSSFSSIGKIISPHCPLIGSGFPPVHGLDQSQRSDCDHETERQKLEAKREKLRRCGHWDPWHAAVVSTQMFTLRPIRFHAEWECWRIFELSIAVLWTRQVPQDLSRLWFNSEGSFGHLFWLVQSLFAVAVVFSTISTAPATGEDTLLDFNYG